jgi:Peptidase family M28
LAETATGNDANTVMAGAHLDSVQDGPGTNDKGSGSAALLETAIQMGKVKPNNTVRFAWWGAEESGLPGSEHYAGTLSEAEAARIALHLNFDMVASPNYVSGIYDGDNSGGTAAPGFIPPGSAQIEVLRCLLRQPRAAVPGLRVLGPVRRRAVHRGRHPCRWPLHRRGGAQDGRRGCPLRRCRRSGLRPLLPLGVRQPLRRGPARGALYAALREDYDLVGNINTTEALDVNADAIPAAVIPSPR